MANHGFTQRMRSLPLGRTLAATAGVAGATLLGVSLGGMATVDSELAASVTPTPTVRYDRVVYEPDRSGRGSLAYGTPARGDCPRPSRTTDTPPEL